MSDDGILEKSKTLQAAEAAVEKWGFPEPTKPTHTVDGEIPIWPDNVADLTLQDLSHHLTWWTGWMAYIQHHLGRAQTNLSGFEETLNYDQDKFIFSSGIGKGDDKDYETVTEAKAAFRQSPNTAKLTKKVVEAKAIVRVLKSLLSGYEEKRFTVSRELTARGIDEAKGGQRGDRYTA